MKSPKENPLHRIGRAGEKAAAKHLKKQGYRILARNCHLGKNELDIIAANKETIAFVEVKARSFDTAEESLAVRPAVAVDLGKRQRTLQAARAYLLQNPSKKAPRLDVIEVYLLRGKKYKLLALNHIENAFDAKGRSN